MTTMLDKAAEALCARTEGRDDVWHDLSAGDRDGYKDLARAALQAIRVVDQETFRAGEMAMPGYNDCGPGDPWLAMIDAILSEKA